MSNEQDEQSREQFEVALPQGVKLLHTLKSHQNAVLSISFDPSGAMLASGSRDKTVKLWDVFGGRLLNTLKGHGGIVYSVVFSSKGEMLASGGGDSIIKLWEVAGGDFIRSLRGHSSPIASLAFSPVSQILASGGFDYRVHLWQVTRGGFDLTRSPWEAVSGKLLHTLKGHDGIVYSIAFSRQGEMLASGGQDATVKLWEVSSGRLLRSLEGHSQSVHSVAFDPMGELLVSASSDSTVKLWGVGNGRLLRTLEGHTSRVDAVVFSADGRILASKSNDGTLRLWNCETWETAAIIPEPTHPDWFIQGVAFHPALPLMATVGSRQWDRKSTLIHLWELDFDVLLSTAAETNPALKAVHHSTAKIVLVGDSGVGKTGLGWRLAHGEFKEHSSTHGQQFWVLDELGTRREDGTECEAILWDLAGQPDYRLIHALFLDDADLALVLFDPTDSREPLHGVEFWLKQLRSGRKKSGDDKGYCPVILVGARADRGESRLTSEEIEEFCRQRGLTGGYLATSAKEGVGLDELLRRMKEQIAWEQKSATVTTVTFKRIKDYVLGLKESRQWGKVIVSPQELRRLLEKTDRAWEFTDAEMATAGGHLANYGYVRMLRTSKGEERVLLSPELLNNLAASFVMEARRNPRGLGSLEESLLLAGKYQFRELERLTEEERDVLLDSAALLFLKHNVCFRETALGGQSYLIFPELINLKKPLLEGEQPTEDGVAYTISGAVENVYASLVVLLGYTQTFTRTDQWRSHARYEVGDGLICGFRQDAEREGELDFVLYFGTNVGKPVRTLFQGLFESFLGRRNLSVFRLERVVCARCTNPLDRSVVRTKARERKEFTFCNDCGEKIYLPKDREPIQLVQRQQEQVEMQRRIADVRTRFEQALFRVQAFIKDRKIKAPECFISYAWGNPAHERWVEKSLATDLQKAGINVVLDHWENARVGASMSRFVARIEKCDLVIVVGTPLYREKYENRNPDAGYVVAAEVDLISERLLGAQAARASVLPVLLEGDKKKSLPPLFYDKVLADFRDERVYFTTAFDLILSIYNIPPNHQAVADLRELLRASDLP